jgi:hypothetical protein
LRHDEIESILADRTLAPGALWLASWLREQGL